MAFSIFINFDGNCKEAVTYYAEVFKKDVPKMMLTKDSPEIGSIPLSEDDQNRVMFTSLTIEGTEVMFADTPKIFNFVVGNNISPFLSLKDRSQVEEIYAKLKVDGNMSMEPQKTFWSPLYGMVEDKFGIIWQLSYDDGTVYRF